jgi:hypothetical protein
MSPRLIARAWSELLFVDLVHLRGFSAIERVVKRTPTRPTPIPDVGPAELIAAIKTASVLYLKPIKCLQRSAAVTRLLRRRGIPAQMVIGCRMPPLQAHAWVEVAGEIISDDFEGLEYYRILDRW